MDIAPEMLTKFNNDPDLPKKVITDVESWAYGYDIETKAQRMFSCGKIESNIATQNCKNNIAWTSIRRC